MKLLSFKVVCHMQITTKKLPKHCNDVIFQVKPNFKRLLNDFIKVYTTLQV